MSRSIHASGLSDPSLRVRARGNRPALDLGRDVYALFGLVFDATSVEATAQHLRRCAVEGTRCFVSTPNLNFAAGARTDAAFRDSVLQSDLSLADGAPIVRLARLMGLPIKERVAGADLFDRLRCGKGAPPLKVFFFGGVDGVAERAADVLNAEAGGLVCVGHCSPGFGTIEAMSGDAIIENINASGADFVVVSLGAKKGQAWIQRNRARLTAPLVSHLGAVVNFVAGDIQRAPPWMQRIGLEWLWRIKEEPALWRRYGGDALVLLPLLIGALPALLASAFARDTHTEPAAMQRWTDGATTVLSLTGSWTHVDLPHLRRALADTLNAGDAVQLDLVGLQDGNAALLALIALVDRWQQKPRAITSTSVLRHRVRARFGAAGLDYLIDHLEPAGRSA